MLLRLCTLLLTVVATLGQIQSPSSDTATCNGSSCFTPTKTATFTARPSCNTETGSFCQPTFSPEATFDKSTISFTPIPSYNEELPSMSPRPVPSYNEELPSMSPRPVPSYNEELPSMSPRPVPSYNEELPSMSPIPSFDTSNPTFSPIPSFRDDPLLNLPPTVKDCLRRMILHMLNHTLPTGTSDPLVLFPLFLDENGTMPMEFKECFGTIDPPPQSSFSPPPCTISDGSPCPSFPPRPSIDPSLPPPPPPQPSVDPPCTTSDGSPCPPPPTFDPIVKECLQTVISNMFNESSIQSMDPFFALPMLFTNGTFPPEIRECFELIEPPIQGQPSFTPLPSMRPEQLNIPASIRDCIVKLIIHRFNTTDPQIIQGYLHYAIYLHYNGTAPEQIEECFGEVTTMATMTSRPEMPSMSSKPVPPSMSSRPTIQVLEGPSISSKPELPSQSVRPSMSSRPSRLPLRVSVNPIAAAVIEQVRQRLASLSPLPSPSKPAPPRISMARSPMPSPWFVPPSRSAAPSRNPGTPVDEPTPFPSKAAPPPYIDNQLKIKGADPVEMTKPEKIQELQASLACTLLMPLENIQIRSFSILYINGTKVKLPIDPSEFRMSSGGEAGCFMPSRNSSRLLRMRRLQNSEGSVVVDYTIVEPPEEITTLSSEELTTVLASSDVLSSTVSSVGGIQISSEVAVEAAAQAQPSQTPNTLSTTNTQSSSATFGQMVTYIAAPVGTLLVISAVAFIAIKFYKEKNIKLQKELEKVKKNLSNPVQVLVKQADVFSNRNLISINNPVARERKVPIFDDLSETYRVAMAPMTPGNKSQV